MRGDCPFSESDRPNFVEYESYYLTWLDEDFGNGEPIVFPSREEGYFDDSGFPNTLEGEGYGFPNKVWGMMKHAYDELMLTKSCGGCWSENHGGVSDGCGWEKATCMEVKGVGESGYDCEIDLHPCGDHHSWFSCEVDEDDYGYGNGYGTEEFESLEGYEMRLCGSIFGHVFRA